MGLQFLYSRPWGEPPWQGSPQIFFRKNIAQNTFFKPFKHFPIKTILAELFSPGGSM